MPEPSKFQTTIVIHRLIPQKCHPKHEYSQRLTHLRGALASSMGPLPQSALLEVASSLLS